MANNNIPSGGDGKFQNWLPLSNFKKKPEVYRNEKNLTSTQRLKNLGLTSALILSTTFASQAVEESFCSDNRENGNKLCQVLDLSPLTPKENPFHNAASIMSLIAGGLFSNKSSGKKNEEVIEELMNPLRLVSIASSTPSVDLNTETNPSKTEAILRDFDKKIYKQEGNSHLNKLLNFKNIYKFLHKYEDKILIPRIKKLSEKAKHSRFDFNTQVEIKDLTKKSFQIKVLEKFIEALVEGTDRDSIELERMTFYHSLDLKKNTGKGVDYSSIDEPFDLFCKIFDELRETRKLLISGPPNTTDSSSADKQAIPEENQTNEEGLDLAKEFNNIQGTENSFIELVRQSFKTEIKAKFEEFVDSKINTYSDEDNLGVIIDKYIAKFDDPNFELENYEASSDQTDPTSLYDLAESIYRKYFGAIPSSF